MKPQTLSRIILHGFKSIRECDIKLCELNVLIGANGAGKSNFISFFHLMQQILDHQLQHYVSKQGGPDSLLYFGRKKTEQLCAEFSFTNYAYKFALEPTVDNRMMYAKEIYVGNNMGTGHFESAIEFDHQLTIKSWRVYHFHDTGENARIKAQHSINDNQYLRPDASNLAAFLYRLKKQYPKIYQRIVQLVQFIAPFFGDFLLRPHIDNSDIIELEWTEKNNGIPFKAHQLSDGTLRFICLTTVLNQPETFQPEMILIDEPELGLHPRAIGFLAAMLRSVSKIRQVIVSTQSVSLVNEFSVNNLIVVEREQGTTVFHRYREADFYDWLEEYSVGDLWQKNVLGN